MKCTVSGKSFFQIRAGYSSAGRYDRIPVSTFFVIFFTVSGDFFRGQKFSRFETGMIMYALTAEPAVFAAAALPAVYDHAQIHMIPA